MTFNFDRLNSPVSPLLVVNDGDGRLRALEFADHEARMHRLLRSHYGDYELKVAPAPESIRAALVRYFDGDLHALDPIVTATGGTDFQRSVWAALRRIPAGETTSYGQLASQIGRAGAGRAVGAANGANPIAIVVPCHRVIGSSGTLTGYAGGLANKQWLLDHERRCSAILA